MLSNIQTHTHTLISFTVSLSSSLWWMHHEHLGVHCLGQRYWRVEQSGMNPSFQWLDSLMWTSETKAVSASEPCFSPAGWSLYEADAVKCYSEALGNYRDFRLPRLFFIKELLHVNMSSKTQQLLHPTCWVIGSEEQCSLFESNKQTSQIYVQIIHN